MTTVTFDKATRIFPKMDRPAVDALDLRITDGEFMVLVGPSGCGKSTCLRMLAGLEEVDSGTIRIGDRDVTFLPPKDRDIAMVFQNYALYPHMTVAENMGFALKIAGLPKDVIRGKVADAAKILDLTEYLGRKPKALSGGQRQRVAMGRAIVREPQVFLMDEPLSNLDAKLRVQTRTQIASLQRRLGTTTVYVTHDQVEALTMGDRVAVLKDGVLQQVGTPKEVYEQPDNVFVAGFIGSPAMNLFTVPCKADGARLGGAWVPLPRATVAAASEHGGEGVVLGIRPEHFTVVSEESEEAAMEVSVDAVEELGSDAFVYGTVRVGDEAKHVVVRVGDRQAPHKGDRLRAVPLASAVHVFAAATGSRLPVECSSAPAL